jgi:hypothetical protein
VIGNKRLIELIDRSAAHGPPDRSSWKNAGKAVQGWGQFHVKCQFWLVSLLCSACFIIK